MRVILLDKVENLGNLGEQINVKPGYARNFLIRKGKAILATPQNIEFFTARQAELENKLANILAEANARASKISELCTLTISSKAGRKGKLFGSISSRDIAKAVTAAAGIKVTKNEVRLPNGVLRTIGLHEVGFQLHAKVFIQLTINVIPE